MTQVNGREEKEKSEESLVCSECGSRNITTKEEEYKFEYGLGEKAVELKAIVPLRTCGDCGCSFLDGEAEDLCHEEICKHLGVMNPTQIKDLRGLYDLTQAQFSKITKLGEATLSRWERGIIIQNEAYDNYLYLLGFKENFERVRYKSSKIKNRSFDKTEAGSETSDIKLRKIPEAYPSFQLANTTI